MSEGPRHPEINQDGQQEDSHDKQSADVIAGRRTRHSLLSARRTSGLRPTQDNHAGIRHERPDGGRRQEGGASNGVMLKVFDPIERVAGDSVGAVVNDLQILPRAPLPCVADS